MPVPVPLLRIFLLDAAAPALDALARALPGLCRTPLGVEIPLRDCAPEEVLALCLRLGITARATRIVDPRPAGSDAPRV